MNRAKATEDAMSWLTASVFGTLPFGLYTCDSQVQRGLIELTTEEVEPFVVLSLL